MQRNRQWYLGAFALLVLAALGLGLNTLAPRLKRVVALEAPHFHGKDVSAENRGMAFVLSDSSGRRVSLDDYLGKAVILTFGYTHCPEACPTTLARLAKARRLLGADAGELQVLFVTVDPKHDTAEFLGRYVQTFDATFVGLRGDDSEIRPVAEAYRAQYRLLDLDGETLVDHTVDSYLIDPSGHTRVVLHYAESAAEVAEDVRAAIDSAGFCSGWLRWPFSGTSGR